MLKSTFKIGITQVVLEMPDFKNLCRASAILGECASVGVCDNCQKSDYYLAHNKSQAGDDFYYLKCKCGARKKIHLRKDGGYYLDSKDKFEVYQAKSNDGPKPAPATASTGEGEGQDEVPF